MPDLLAIRTRVDLVLDRTDLTNAEKDIYINYAQRWLDRQRGDNSKTLSRHHVALAAGDFQVTFKQARSIKKVWVQKDAPTARTELIRMTYDGFRNEFGEDLSVLTRGAPTHYTPIAIGLSPDQRSKTAGDFDTSGIVDVDDVMHGDHWAFDAILIGPPPDTALSLGLFANFYSLALNDDADVSYWTTRHPEMLVRAYFLQLEMDARNTQGVRDWMESLLPDIQHLDDELVEQGLGDALEMEMKG